MSDRNERYDSGTGRTLEELEKVYFQKAEPGSSPEPSKPQAAARRQTASRSTARRRSASNAAARRTTQKSRPAKTGSKSLKNPLAGRSNKTPKRGRKNTAPARSRTAQADAGKVSDKLVFTPLPPEGYEAQAQNKAQEPVARKVDTGAAAKNVLDNIGSKGAVYISDTKRSMQDMRRRTAENAYRRRTNMKGMSAGEKASYMLSQIGPTVRSVQSEPKRREAAYKILIVLIALLLAIHWTSCINDILGFARSDKEKVIVVEEGDTTNQLIGKFDRAGLIKHSTVCKLFIATTSGIRNDNDKYLKGEFTLTPDMGIEKMLSTCTATQKRETVEITFPEGFTVEQIAEKLEESKVCSKSDFLKATNVATYSYDFVKDIANGDQRYHLLEGYMYPDTYEFYVGEDAASVVSKLLGNFHDKWTSSRRKTATRTTWRSSPRSSTTDSTRPRTRPFSRMPRTSTSTRTSNRTPVPATTTCTGTATALMSARACPSDPSAARATTPSSRSCGLPARTTTSSLMTMTATSMPPGPPLNRTRTSITL